MKRLISKLIRKKNKGQSDLICSLFVIIALIAVLFLSVGIVKDISKVTVVDQVARQGIIKLEIQGKLSNTERNDISQKLIDAGLKFDSSHTLEVNGRSVPDGVYVAYKDSSDKWIIDTSPDNVLGNDDTYNSYGKDVAIYIQCQAKTFSFGGNIFGGNSEEHYTNITRLKASITKKAN